MDPEGGQIIRDVLGNPTGIFVDNAMALISTLHPQETPEEKREGILAAIAKCHELGITGVHDASRPTMEEVVFFFLKIYLIIFIKCNNITQQEQYNNNNCHSFFFFFPSIFSFCVCVCVCGWRVGYHIFSNIDIMCFF